MCIWGRGGEEQGPNLGTPTGESSAWGLLAGCDGRWFTLRLMDNNETHVKGWAILMTWQAAVAGTDG